MLDNLKSVEDLGSVARKKGRDYETKTVHTKLVEENATDGWVEDQKNENSVRLRRPKAHNQLLEDRVWTLLYRMGFTHLSDHGGGVLTINPHDTESPTTQIDVVGIDYEIALAVECKSAETLSKRAHFQDELGKHALIRGTFSSAIKKMLDGEHKRQVVLAMFHSNIILSDNDKARAKEANVVLFDEQDLTYYETLVGHLGTAAKYQFFADMLPGKEVPGLEICVPAIRFKMGDRWFELIRNAASDWWDKGSLPGGGLAMNDGVGAGVGVLKSVFQHLEKQGKKLIGRDSGDLFELVKKYGEALAAYIGSLSEDEKKKFRDLRGAQGVGTRVRHGEKAIREKFPDFNPDGLDEFLEKEKAQTNSRAKEIIDRIEVTLQKEIISELKEEFGEQESDWWMEGVPKQVRIEVTKRFEEDDGKRGGKENYFDLIHYRKIVTDNWDLLSEIFAFGKKGVGKEKGTAWMEELNEKRRCVAHSSSGISLSIEDLNQVQEYDDWLRRQIAGGNASASADESIEPENSSGS